MAPVSFLEGEVRFAVAASRVRRTTESAAQCSGAIAEWTAASDAAGEINEKKSGNSGPLTGFPPVKAKPAPVGAERRVYTLSVS